MNSLIDQLKKIVPEKADVSDPTVMQATEWVEGWNAAISEMEKNLKALDLTGLVEQIVILYANMSGRDDINRAAFREEVRKLLS